MSGRDLGSMGESKVEHWAHERDITPNRVNRDKKGWDIFLQIPKPKTSDIIGEPLMDIVPPEISCLVQVKATDRSKGRIPGIKLSNWSRLAKAPLPVFFIVLEYDGKNDVQKAYLVHLDETWISKTLKRLRKLGSGGESLLHKRTMLLTYSEHDRFTPTGEDLEKSIRSHVGSDPLTYLKKKVKWLETVGFDEHPIKGSFSLPPMPRDQLMTLLVDFSIGLVDELKLASFRAEEIRFGIPRSLHPEPSPDNIRMKIGGIPPSGKAGITITDQEGREIFKDDFDFYSPPSIFPFIPFEFWKSRFVSDFLSFTLSHNSKKINYIVHLLNNHEEKRPLLKMAQAADLILRFRSSGLEPHKMNFTVRDMNFSIDLHSPEFPPAEPGFDEALEVVKDAQRVVEGFENSENILVSIKELLTQKNRIRAMKALIEENDQFWISAYVDTERKEDIDLSSLAFVMGTLFSLGDTTFIITGSIEGEGEIVEEEKGFKVTINNGTGKCIKKWSIPADKLKTFSFKDAFSEAYELVAERGVESIVIMDEGISNSKPTASKKKSRKKRKR